VPRDVGLNRLERIDGVREERALVIELAARVHDLADDLERVVAPVEHHRRLERDDLVAVVEASAELRLEPLVARALRTADLQVRNGAGGCVTVGRAVRSSVGARRCVPREQGHGDERDDARAERQGGEGGAARQSLREVRLRSAI
jgi:hypothetical protein